MHVNLLIYNDSGEPIRLGDLNVAGSVVMEPGDLELLLNCSPRRMNGRETTLALAVQAFRRAESTPSTGVGCVVSRDDQSESNRAFVAIQSESRTVLVTVTSDAPHERFACDLVSHAIGWAHDAQNATPAKMPQCHVAAETAIAPPALTAVWTGRQQSVWRLPDGTYADAMLQSPGGILSGSFDPRHFGHSELRTAAQRFLGGPVLFELPLQNADKPPLDFLSISARLRQFDDVPLAITSAGTFVEKAELFPKTTFVVGSDTAERIVHPRFYGNSTDHMHRALSLIRENGCRFLVAGRKAVADFRTLDDLATPIGFSDLFEPLPPRDFRRDVSSSEIRCQKGSS